MHSLASCSQTPVFSDFGRALKGLRARCAALRAPIAGRTCRTLLSTSCCGRDSEACMLDYCVKLRCTAMTRSS